LYKDTGFQGYEPKVRKSVQPKKSLTRKNWLIKRKKTIARYPKFVSKWNMPFQGSSVLEVCGDVLRNTKDGFSDLVMVIACSLHNLRVDRRKKPLKLWPKTYFR
jgi:hypothetical protein